MNAESWSKCDVDHSMTDPRTSKPYPGNEAGYALSAKRPSRPFPPPFVSLPTTSFSDPLTTYRPRRQDPNSRYEPHVNGRLIRGVTNGDDAVVASRNFLGVNDGVGAWADKERGHAALWSRLIAHFHDLAVERMLIEEPNSADSKELDPIGFLQEAYEMTTGATGRAKGILGTTTAVSALLHWKSKTNSKEEPSHPSEFTPVLHVTTIGDCKVLVIRPSATDTDTGPIIFRTKEQWHWFDCPKQLGSNSKDTPRGDAVCDSIDLREGDVVIAMSDGVTDNLWENEICNVVLENLQRDGKDGRGGGSDYDNMGPMVDVAIAVRNAAKEVAEDPFSESPYMERAVDEGLPIEGGEC
ncbi:MAG: hypothetical protein Q9160_004929 [Pyrenula sp. 1 TL-2023]